MDDTIDTAGTASAETRSTVAPPAFDGITDTAAPSVAPPPFAVGVGDAEKSAEFAGAVGARLRREIGKAIRGQETVVDAALVALFAGGHALFEGVPGTAKTLLVRSLAAACAAGFKRIQFTPDLMPSDILGTNVFDPQTVAFHLRPGPVFSDIVLADEVNRTPPKTQSALLEAMEERRVTVDGVTHQLPDIFTVFATQNPIEYEGTYPLPEAQLDRFLLKVVIDYPTEDAESSMLSAWNQGFRAADLTTAGIEACVTIDELTGIRASLPSVRVEPNTLKYITTIVRRTRAHKQLLLGASPRASVSLLQASKARALLSGRPFVTPEDIKSLALPVLRHRVLLRPEAELEGVGVDRVLQSIVDSVEIPR